MRLSTSSSVTTSPKILAIYIGLLIDVIERINISAEELLEGSGIKPEQINDVYWYVDFDVFSRLFARAVMLTNEPGLGFLLGLQMKVSCHGLVGFAAMIGKDVREALEVAQQFVSVLSTAFTIRLSIGEESSSLYIHETFPEYSVGDSGVMALALGFAMMGEAVTGHRLEGIAEFTCTRPDYFSRFENLIPGQVRFEQPHTRLIFPNQYLDLPLIMADPMTARMAREQCKRELNAVMKNSSFSRLVGELAFDEALGFCTLEDVADKLHMSPRTLQRQLAQEDQSFSSVIDALRQRKATALLKQRELSLESIAEKLGYTDTANFTRAFKRWTGMTPRKFTD
ncbi:MAG: AraC family transcriptional regulator [Candidatus Saccharibacteria bacterium]|nr:AraC family transcriptional regulator [Moraxellaceae bacterium]